MRSACGRSRPRRDPPVHRIRPRLGACQAAKRASAASRVSRIPGYPAPCAASSTSTTSASGHNRPSCHAMSGGPLTSSRPCASTPGNPGQLRGPGEQLAVGQERRVRPVVRDETGEDQPELGVVVTRVGLDLGTEGHVPVLPPAPFARCLVAYHRVRSASRRAYAADRSPSRSSGGTASRKRAHSAGKTRPMSRTIHSTSRRRGPDAEQHHLATCGPGAPARTPARASSPTNRRTAATARCPGARAAAPCPAIRCWVVLPTGRSWARRRAACCGRSRAGPTARSGSAAGRRSAATTGRSPSPARRAGTTAGLPSGLP